MQFSCLLHGGDYNPDQWLDRPDILAADIDLMKKAHINCVSVGIFAWSRLEPEEGRYDFDWLEAIITNLYQNGISTILATPSGAKPAWMSRKYPEIRRVSRDMTRDLHGKRHNHCYTSPVYREKVRQINTALAERFAHHPGVILWHLSNEYGGKCYCPLCQQAFRGWLREKYGTLDALNKAWWTDFWSHRYSSWDEIEAPVPAGEESVHGLNLDWNRFCTHQTNDFIRWEAESVKAVRPDLPVTANFMYFFDELDYYTLKDSVDIISWDAYPTWGENEESEAEVARRFAFNHDLMRSLKKQPFLLMESSPSATNWQPVSKLKRPGVHMLSSMQAIAHGSNSVQYFQWRKSRGAFEKFHGAVVDHYGGSDTRVFRDVAQVGARLEALGGLIPTCNRSQVAIVYDWENLWAVNDAKGPRNCGIKYRETVLSHYAPFWKMGINVDVIDETCDLDGYRLVILPMLYLLRGGFAEKLRRFTDQGGTVVATYWTGIVDSTDLCWLGGMPGDGLMELFGLRSEEIDALYDGQYNSIKPQQSGLFPAKDYRVSELCDLVIPSTAQTLAVYGSDFYAGRPALTVNQFGQGEAYYIAARAEDALQEDFYGALAQKLHLDRALSCTLPEGVTAVRRSGDSFNAVTVMNFTPTPQEIRFPETAEVWETGAPVNGALSLAPYEVVVLKLAASSR